MMTKAQSASIFVANCELGRGLFAARGFAAGETILRFTGPLIGLADAIAKGDTEGNPLQVSPTDYIDLEPPGVFANHSCEPNAGIRDNTILVALQLITVGEEIRYDYSTTMWEDGGALETALPLSSRYVPWCRRQFSDVASRAADALSGAWHRSGLYRSTDDARESCRPGSRPTTFDTHRCKQLLTCGHYEIPATTHA